MNQKNDSSDDLKNLDKNKLEHKLSDLNFLINKISQTINKLYDERQSLNLMSLAMTNDLENIEGLPKDQQEVLIEVKNRQNKANELREQRDLINSKIILPEQAILENLYMYYFRLTGEENDLRYPSLKKEIEMFSRFLELQEMFTQKVESTRCHNEFQLLMEEQTSTIEKLNEMRKDSGKTKLVFSKGKKDKKSPVGFKIYKINKKISSNKKKLYALKQKKSKIESRLGKKKHRRKYNIPDLSNIQEKISEGGTLSLDDLGALLKHGKGIQEIEKSTHKTKNVEKEIKAQPKRRVQTSRGRRRGGPRDSSLRNDRD